MKRIFIICFFLALVVIPQLIYSQNLQKRQELINEAQLKIDSFFTLIKEVTPERYAKRLEKFAPITDSSLEKSQILFV